jgi:hypothetical protein
MARQYRSGNSNYRRSSNYGSGRSDGYERARQHIEDAHRLSRELGGTDVDVKRYFFALPEKQLEVILVEYGTKFGSRPEEYARETMHKWQSGKVQMSGTVAERLFKLLPPHMPLNEKYMLTESLWTHFGPKSKKRLRIGLTADLNAAVIAIDEHIEQVVTFHQIPKEMEARFDWLAHGDVEVKQQVLNHLRGLERKLVSDGARLQLPVMVDHLKTHAGDLTQRMTQTLKVGNHELELFIDREFDGIALEEWKPPVPPAREAASDYGWVIWLIIIAAIIFWWN